jgi:hypothetical protein
MRTGPVLSRVPIIVTLIRSVPIFANVIVGYRARFGCLPVADCVNAADRLEQNPAGNGR